MGGKREAEGPLGGELDQTFQETPLYQESWERAEAQLQKEAVSLALGKAGVPQDQVDFILAGDLLNQCISSTFGLMGFGIPFLGQYGACSTMAQTLLLASILVESGAARKALAVTSSHFCSAERQFRLPLEYGGQRPPTAQWTATASGCVLVGEGGKVQVRRGLAGRIQDLGVKDPANMGAAMAPAAADSIYQFLEDTHTTPQDYDGIFTGTWSGGLPAVVSVFAGKRGGHRAGAPGLWPAPLRPPQPGRPRRRFRVWVLRRCTVRPSAPSDGAGGAEEHLVLRHRGADVPHIPAAGAGHPRGVPRGAADGFLKGLVASCRGSASP